MMPQARAPLRILEVSPYAPGVLGGLEKVVQYLCKEFAGLGATVGWCTSDIRMCRSVPGIEYHPMRSWDPLYRWGMSFPLWSPISLLRMVAKIESYDIVHIHDYTNPGCIAVFWIAKMRGKTTIVTLHCPIIAIAHIPWLTPLVILVKIACAYLVFPWADGVTVVGDLAKQSLKQLIKREVTTIRNTADPHIFRPLPSEERKLLRGEMGWENDENVCLFIGRFVNEKGLPIIRSLARAIPEWRWVLVGKGQVEPREWKLPNVTVVDPIHDDALIARYYQAADIFILPSKKEGLSLALCEALNCGLPSAVHYTIAHTTICSDGSCISVGTPCDEATTNAWITSLRAFAKHNKKTRLRLTQAISWQDVARKYVTEFERVHGKLAAH